MVIKVLRSLEQFSMKNIKKKKKVHRLISLKMKNKITFSELGQKMEKGSLILQREREELL